MEKLSQGLGKPTVFLGGAGLRTQRVRWDETLAKPNLKLLSPHALYYTNISWYTVPNGSARLQAPVSQGLNRDSLKSLNISRFSGLVGRRSLSPELYWLRLEYWIREVSKMTIYEIISLAINVAILILGLLSYLK